MNKLRDEQNSLKLFITKIFGNGELLDVTGIHELVAAGYPGGNEYSMTCIAEQLRDLQEEGLLSGDGFYINDEGEPVSLYRISEFGLGRLHECR
ncbi:hypothetical protein [Maridesulfovibrio sp.]|uniref:hypothetical protein n=1 Tax=Maridesulfovibrio sp. TaxID=2795000 RepID=UPI002A18E807|nr:hypothetical protein [Maridesulfovibrio sp.]